MPNRLGSTGVPAASGLGSSQTIPSTAFVRNVETFSVKGGGAAPESGEVLKSVPGAGHAPIDDSAFSQRTILVAADIR